MKIGKTVLLHTLSNFSLEGFSCRWRRRMLQKLSNFKANRVEYSVGRVVQSGSLSNCPSAHNGQFVCAARVRQVTISLAIHCYPPAVSLGLSVYLTLLYSPRDQCWWCSSWVLSSCTSLPLATGHKQNSVFLVGQFTVSRILSFSFFLSLSEHLQG